MMLRSLMHPVIREWLAILLVLCAGIVISVQQEWLFRLDQTLYDRAVRLWQRPTQSDIAVIGLDEDSLAQIGRWPWRRAIHATLIDRLTAAGELGEVHTIIQPFVALM